MLNASIRRKILLLVLIAVLGTPWAVSAAGLGSEIRPARAEMADQDLITRFWNVLAGTWSKIGCHIDPDGRCAPQKEGCHIDPDGHVRCTP